MSKSVRDWMRSKVKWRWFEPIVMGAVGLNSITLGIETYAHDLTVEQNHALWVIDVIFLVFFSAELLVRLYVYRWSFFKEGWNWLDFFVVVVSWLPMLGNVSALRAFRILRVLRILKFFPQFRFVIEVCLRALAHSAAAFGVLIIVVFVCAVMSSKLFGTFMPEEFGNLHLSAITHFQLMFGDDWGAIARPLTMEYGYAAGLYFKIYTIITGPMLAGVIAGIFIESVLTVSREEQDTAEE